MSGRWNSDFFIAMEHRDLQANAMALNNSGSYVLLAGRRYIAIRNLDDTETDNLKKFPRQSKYDVGSAEWNPTDHHSELCVISCNQRLEVLTWHTGELTQTHSLKAHTRVITDLNWHRQNPHLLASSSVDTFIHLWDLRDTRRPTTSLSAIAEASQVRWNFKNAHLLATAHDGDIKVWDTRKGTAPVLYISAHLAKIYGLDWNPNVETQLTTSSQDNTVKFFDITNPKRPAYILNSSAPVWRARYTPFGTGLITVVVPQLRRGENSLLLWNTSNRSAPVHTFMGHRDVVLEFEWRKKKANDADFQLVTWSKDQSLLVWRIEPYLQKLCGVEAPSELIDTKDSITTSNEQEIVEGIEAMKFSSNSKLHALQQEFSLMNVQIPNLDLIKMDVMKRICTVRAKTQHYLVNLQVLFPHAYPNHVPPNFVVMQGSSIDEKAAGELIQTLAQIAQQRVVKNRSCLEPCLRKLVTWLEALPQDSNKMFANNFIEAQSIFGSYNDAYIPFPRTSGARFCSVSVLVCFGRTQTRRVSTTKVDSTTPRALSALGSMFGSKRTSDQISISLFYNQKQRARTKLPLRGFKPMVVVYDMSSLFLINKNLAKQYILDDDAPTICKWNANVTAKLGRRDLVQAWTLAELAVTPQQDDEFHSNANPLETQLMQSLIEHYASQNDIQMAAMLTCVFGKDRERKQSLKTIVSPTSGDASPYHTIPSADVVNERWVFVPPCSTRANSLNNLKIEEYHEQKGRTASTSVYEYYKLAYAETLHRWGLLYKRTEVLKFMCTTTEAHRGVEFLAACQQCNCPSKQCSCVTCNKITLNCVICHVSVRGSSNCCLVCGHGGHTEHLRAWFADHVVCPSGCGCRCLNHTFDVFHRDP